MLISQLPVKVNATANLH